MEQGYYWIKRRDCNHKEIALFNINRMLFFTIGSTYGLSTDEVDYKEPVRKDDELETTAPELCQDVTASTLTDYDSGLINDYGGGATGWWRDYIRAEVDAANEHWRQQLNVDY